MLDGVEDAVHALSRLPVAVVLAVFALGVVVTFWAAFGRGVRPVVVLLVVCALWLRVNRPLEGRLVYYIEKGHGITTSDLVVPAALVFVAVVRGVRWLRARPPERPGDAATGGA